MEVYLDNSATTRPRPEAVEAMVDVLTHHYGNPSSLHRKGLDAERILNGARETIAAILSVSPGEIVFTSGGTEANNMALKGVAAAHRREGRHVILTAIEHPSVLECCRELETDGFEVECLPVNRQGLLDPAVLASRLRPDTVLVSTMHVNNEVGSIQPIDRIGAVLRDFEQREGVRPVWHVDAVQSFGRIPVEPRRWGADLVSVSAHKIHGPKGAGALYIREGVRILPLLRGGEQERGLRAGTENVPAMAGFERAARLAAEQMGENAARMACLKDRLAGAVLAAFPWSRINGPEPGPAAAPHIINISFPGLKGELVVHHLEARGIYVSTGSACSSRRPAPSHVLQALGLRPEEVAGGIRLSFCPANTPEEVDAAVAALKEVVAELRPVARMGRRRPRRDDRS